MAGQVDQDVDLVRPDTTRQQIVRHTISARPVIRIPLEYLGHIVFGFKVRICMDLKSRLIVVRHQGLQEKRHRMMTEVG